MVASSDWSSVLMYLHLDSAGGVRRPKMSMGWEGGCPEVIGGAVVRRSGVWTQDTEQMSITTLQ